MKMFLMVVGFVMLALANFGGLGYGLYLWGGTGMAIGLAAWTAFKFWVLWMVLGIVSFIIGGFMFSTDKMSSTKRRNDFFNEKKSYKDMFTK